MAAPLQEVRKREATVRNSTPWLYVCFGKSLPKSGPEAFHPWTNPLSREGFLRSRAQLEI